MADVEAVCHLCEYWLLSVLYPQGAGVCSRFSCPDDDLHPDDGGAGLGTAFLQHPRMCKQCGVALRTLSLPFPIERVVEKTHRGRKTNVLGLQMKEAATE